MAAFALESANRSGIMALPARRRTRVTKDNQPMEPNTRRPRRTGLYASLLWAMLLAAVLHPAGGCSTPRATGPADSFGLEFPPADSVSGEGALVFFVDGVDNDTFDEMLRAGELPAIQRYFVDRGLYCPRAVVNTPSVTLANLTSFVTGQFPGHHGITGINWFDRNQLIWRNYETISQKNDLDHDYTSPTIYEQFPHRTTFSLFFQPHRGATKFVENWLSAGPPYFFQRYEYVDRLTLHRLNIVADVMQRRSEIPAITIAYLIAPDFRAYKHGASDPRYRESLRHTDYQIGRVLGDLDRAGLLDRIVIAFVSDHGMIDVHTHFSIDRVLGGDLQMALAPHRLYEATSFRRRQAVYSRYNAVTYGSGDRYVAICLRRPADDSPGSFEPWLQRPTADHLRAYPIPFGLANLPALLADLPAVDAVAYAEAPDRVRVRTAAGEVEFAQPGGQNAPIIYRLIEGSDPLGWSAAVDAEVLAGQALPPRQWLEATADTRYPDLPAQIVAYFRARRAGDIAVFAAEGYDFGNVHNAGHGGLLPGEKLVPILLAGPGVPHGRLAHARLTDVMPTLLHLLGSDAPANLDGESLIKD